MSLTVNDILADGGLIARALPNYESRPEQLEMAHAVADAFETRSHLLAEAGTGVGKSFAYLVPAILRAAEHGQRVVISTYTIALQEQLIQKDLPFLHDALELDFSAVLGKGRHNYLCYRRMVHTAKSRDKLMASQRHEDQLDALMDWAMETETGELQDIDFPVDRAVWSKTCAEAGRCRNAKCQYYQKCHLIAARQKLLKANIVVVNHALFFSDLALKAESDQATLLGEYDLAVLDEAHTIESVASDHFGLSVSNGTVNFLLRELYNDETDRGVLALMGNKTAIASVNRAAAACDAFFAELSEYTGGDIAPNGRIRTPNVIPDTLSPALRDVSIQLRRLRDDIENEENRFELAGYELRAMLLADALERIVKQVETDHAYWFTVHKPRDGFRYNRPTITLASAPINVAPVLRKHLFAEVQSAVLTSATLATKQAGQHGFDYVRQRVGMDDGNEILLASPFDYRNQAKLYLETQLGNPNQLEQFGPMAGAAICHYIDKSQGRCFILATSYKMLNALAEEIEPWCNTHGYDLLVQGQDMQRSAMLKQFRTHDHCVLMGTMSFWQGVDVAGEKLSNVIITKLPFAVPDAPITEARIESIRARGGNPFGEFQLPQAIILFKQGFGRLIRSSQDSGFVVVLDHRIVTKSYGRQFIQSLPDIEVLQNQYMNTK